MSKNLRNLICASIIIYFFSCYANSIELTEENKNYVNCNSDSFGNHECRMQYNGRSELFKVNYDICPAFNVNINNDIVEVFCSPLRDYSNYIYYKNINNDLLFFKYDSAFGGDDSLVEQLSYETHSPYLITLRRSFYNDVKMNNIPKVGFIKSKTFLFDKNGNKTKMYLVKGDKVLILSKKNGDKEWYRVFYQGKKDLDMWIKADSVYLN
ncbi:hypothetical protein [Actinobacillus equuli]|uniref:hypothetical protein n=1 Tax=Actinobacillus equuli TaxID=718 RepID=UPI0024419753|nr:hypothetical protein [Actinobacillus equuli]WGE59466.1 hypothetical protein NYR73_01540 [Actinobacillus equuli subsp. haemolyticus]